MVAGASARRCPGTGQDQCFTLVTGPDAHPERVRFTWSLAADGAVPVAVGVDFATLDGDGRMNAATSFLEPAALTPLSVGARSGGAPTGTSRARR
jgi:hypothetical protein